MTRYTPASPDSVMLEIGEFEELVDRNGILNICLIDPKNGKVSFAFDSYLVYRKLDEGDSLIFLAQFAKDRVSRQSLYLASESEFVSWFVEQSYNIRDTSSLFHYVIVSNNDIIDVISLGEPKIEIGNG